ncbi:MAG TPA: substrate-binding domain-containing protein [Chthoniobacteraceae bacterium]|nr:substrate-binding domain-containing protein [Chthoniobacteraceae bacterium]
MHRPQSTVTGPKARIVRTAILEMLRTQGIKAGEKIASERDLAAGLGFNHQTVRRALADLVADGVLEKRARQGNFVREVARPTPLAIAFPPYLLKEHTSRPSTRLIFDGINDTIDPARFSLTSLSYRYEYFLEDIVRFVEAREIRGLFLVGASQIRPEEVRRIMDYGVKLVLLTQHAALAALGISSFYYDPSLAFAQILAGLAERGHRQIAVFRHPFPARPEMNAIFEDACERHGFGDPRKVEAILPDTPEPSAERFAAVFERRPRPTAIVVPDEIIAIRVFQEAYRRRLFIPDDFSLAAYSDNAPGVFPVPLSAPDTPYWHHQMVSMATRHLMDALEGKPQEVVRYPVGGGVLWRESVANLTPA